MDQHRHLLSTPRLYLTLTSLHNSHPPLSPPLLPVSQQVVGSLLFYARALDLSLLTAVCQLSSHQSIPTQHDLSSAHRLLNYVSSHPNPHKTILPSSMALWACTDASFLSRPKSGSVAGCSVGLGDLPPYLLNPPPERHRQSWGDKQSLVRASHLLQPHSSYPTPPLVTHNAPLHAFCQRIPVVVVSVAEAEYAAAFGGGQMLIELTPTLTNLGHPQQSPPLLFVDNECAIGLATSSFRPKKSKSIDMRHYQGEGWSEELFPSCLPSSPYQPRRLLH